MTSNDSLVDEAVRLVGEAQNAGLVLRMIGGTAIRHHCNRFQHVFDALDRVIGDDIDLAARQKQKKNVVRFLVDKGYTQRIHLTLEAFLHREILDGSDGKHIDVFFDKLEYCHTIPFADRLEIDQPTVPLSELFLQKMQIVQIGEKDLKDSVVLLLEHDVGVGDSEIVNAKRIARLLASEWGFYHTFTINIGKIQNLLERSEVLTDENKSLVKSRTEKLLEYINMEPKSMSWKVRAKIGPNMKWYRDIEEVDRSEWLH